MTEDKMTPEEIAKVVQNILDGLVLMTTGWWADDVQVISTKVASTLRDRGYFQPDAEDAMVFGDSEFQDQVFKAMLLLNALTEDLDRLGTLEEWLEADRRRRFDLPDFSSET